MGRVDFKHPSFILHSCLACRPSGFPFQRNSLKKRIWSIDFMVHLHRSSISNWAENVPLRPNLLTDIL